MTKAQELFWRQGFRGELTDELLDILEDSTVSETMLYYRPYGTMVYRCDLVDGSNIVVVHDILDRSTGKDRHIAILP